MNGRTYAFAFCSADDELLAGGAGVFVYPIADCCGNLNIVIFLFRLVFGF